MTHFISTLVFSFGVVVDQNEFSSLFLNPHCLWRVANWCSEPVSGTVSPNDSTGEQDLSLVRGVVIC